MGTEKAHTGLGQVTSGFLLPPNLPSWPMATHLNLVVPLWSFILCQLKAWVPVLLLISCMSLSNTTCPQFPHL